MLPSHEAIGPPWQHATEMMQLVKVMRRCFQLPASLICSDQAMLVLLKEGRPSVSGTMDGKLKSGLCPAQSHSLDAATPAA